MLLRRNTFWIFENELWPLSFNFANTFCHMLVFSSGPMFILLKLPINHLQPRYQCSKPFSEILFYTNQFTFSSPTPIPNAAPEFDFGGWAFLSTAQFVVPICIGLTLNLIQPPCPMANVKYSNCSFVENTSYWGKKCSELISAILFWTNKIYFKFSKVKY